MQTFLQISGGVALFIGGLWVLLQYLGPKWIDHLFNEKLEEFKRKQEEILETYRHDIQKIFSRAVKVHEQEFVILPKLWDLLQRAKGAVYAARIRMTETPDLTKFTDNEFEIFLTSKNFTDFQRESLKISKDKNKTLVSIEIWHILNRADAACLELRNYYLLNRIFLGAELEEAVGKASDILTRKYVHEKVGQQAAESGAPIQYQEPENEQPYLDKIEKLIQKRLRFEEA